jgi:hypothetical protein
MRKRKDIPQKGGSCLRYLHIRIDPEGVVWAVVLQHTRQRSCGIVKFFQVLHNPLLWPIFPTFFMWKAPMMEDAG